MATYTNTPTYNSTGVKTMIDVDTDDRVSYTVTSTVQTDVYSVQVVLKKGSAVRKNIDVAVVGDSEGSLIGPTAGIGLNITTITGVITFEVLTQHRH